MFFTFSSTILATTSLAWTSITIKADRIIRLILPNLPLTKATRSAICKIRWSISTNLKLFKWFQLQLVDTFESKICSAMNFYWVETISSTVLCACIFVQGINDNTANLQNIQCPLHESSTCPTVSKLLGFIQTGWDVHETPTTFIIPSSKLSCRASSKKATGYFVEVYN